MATKWHSTKFKGVRYREHPTRKHGIHKDRYFVIRYQRAGERTEEKLGWSSQKWTPEKAALELSRLKNAATVGEGPTRLHEKREIADRVRAEKLTERMEQEKRDVTFRQFFEDTYFPVAQSRKKLGTITKELQHFNRWLDPNLGDRPIRSITEIDLQRIIKAMTKAGLAVRTKEYVLSSFRVVWKMARDRGLAMGAYPGKKIKLPKVDNARTRYLRQLEAGHLLERLARYPNDTHDMTLLSLHTGARAKEVFELTWGCVDTDLGSILLKDTKSGKNRYLYMTDWVKRMFLMRQRGARNDRVFLNGRGGVLKEIPRTFRKVVTELGLNDGVDDPRDKVVFHTCRHTFGSWHAQRGTSPNVLKELMGHSTVKVTERYSHVSADHLRQAMNGFEKDFIKEPATLEFNL